MVDSVVRRAVGVASDRAGGGTVGRLLDRLPLWPTLAGVSLVTLLVQLPGPHATAWHWFDDAGRLLLGDGATGEPGGLHLYRDNPGFQFGPLSIVVAVPLTLLGTGPGEVVAMLLASVAGLVALAWLLDAAGSIWPDLDRRVPRSVLLSGGAIVVITWGDVAVRTAHIDDAIALLAVAAALRWTALSVGRPSTTGGETSGTDEDRGKSGRSPGGGRLGVAVRHADEADPDGKHGAAAPGGTSLGGLSRVARPVLTPGVIVTVSLAIAAAAKPWAIMFAPLALVAPAGGRRSPDEEELRSSGPVSIAGSAARGAGTGSRPAAPTWITRLGARAAPTGSAWGAGLVADQRLLEWRRLARVGVVGGLALATWAPFILAEPGTLETARYGIVNDPTSVLRALGVDDPTTPGWVRPAQLLGGTALVGVLVLRGWWPAALLAGVAWRLLLDPAANRYYTIGFVLGALLVELLLRRGRLPWLTLAAAITLEVTALPGIAVLPGRYVRLATVLLALLLVLLLAARGSRTGNLPPNVGAYTDDRGQERELASNLPPASA